MTTPHPGLATLTALLDKGASQGARLLAPALGRNLAATVRVMERLGPERYAAFLSSRGATPMAAVRFGLSGDLQGAAMLSMPPDKALLLAGGELSIESAQGPGPAMAWPFLEAGSALLGRALETMRRGLGLSLNYSRQEYLQETAESLMAGGGPDAGEALAARVRIASDRDAVLADLLLLLSPRCLDVLMSKAAHPPGRKPSSPGHGETPSAEELTHLEILPLGALVLAPNHKVLMWNRHMADLTGVPARAVMGLDIRGRFPALARDQIAGRLASVFTGGPPEIFSAGLHRALFPSPDRRPRLIQLTASPLPRGDNGPRPALILAEDLTLVQKGAERQQRARRTALGEAERLAMHNRALSTAWSDLAGVMDSLPGLVYAVGPDYSLAEVNQPLLARHSVLTRDAAMGRKCHDLFRGRSSPCPDCPAAAALKHGVSGSRPALPGEDDHFGRDAKVLAQPLKGRDGAVLGAVVLSVDVSDLRSVERKLALTRQAAESSNRMKNTFLAAMTREIRSSLTGLMSAAEMALTLDPAPAQKESLHMIKNAAGRTMAILKDVHDLSSIEAGRLTLTRAPFRLSEVLDRALSTAAFECKAKGVELRIGIDPGVPESMIGDADRLSRVLAHLAGNAARFTDKGEVVVEAAMTRPSGERSDAVLISVSDSGPGIEPETCELIRQHFRDEGPPLSGDEDFPGLGLTICRGLVDRMGGRIWVESEPGEGAVFYLTVPAVLSEEPDEPSEPSTAPPPGLTILAVEDDPLYAKFLVHAMSREGHGVQIVNDALQARALLGENGFRVVLLDARSPGMEDMETLRRIREEHPSLPIIAHASGPTPDERDAAVDAGADDFLTKPVSVRRILAAMAMALARRANLSQADDEDELELSKVLDGTALARLYPGEPESARELLDLFLEETPELLQRLSQALERDDLAGAASLAHSLANAAGTIQAPALGRVCARLEEAAKAERRVAARALGEELEREVERTDQAVMAFLETL